MDPFLSVWDWVVIASYGAMVLFIGLRVGRGHQSANDLFLGGRRLPVWAVFCSMVATELSAATFIGVPHAAFQDGGSWAFLQFAFGSLLARVVLATWFLKLYYRLDLVTVYGFLEHRFGRGAELCSAWMFIIGRIFASGTRLFIAALAFATATGFPMEASVILCGGISTIYTLWGGIRAVVYTDTIQGAVFLIAAIASLVALHLDVSGGLPGAFTTASEMGRTQVFFLPSLFSSGTSPETVWGWLADGYHGFVTNYLGSDQPLAVAIIGGFFLTLATHGTDQDMVQRLLTTSSSRKGGLALIGSGLANFPLVIIFLFIGTALWAKYRPDDPTAFTDYIIPKAEHARIFPLFVMHEIPSPLRGLIFAGLFAAAMSSLDSALNSLATTWVQDIRRLRGEEDVVRSSRRSTIVLAVFLIGAALLCIPYDKFVRDPSISLVGLALSSMTVMYGGLLGAFLVGLMTKNRGTPRTIVLGMIISASFGLILAVQPLWTGMLLDGPGKVVVAWPWWIVIGTVISFLIGISGRKTQP